MSIVELDRSVTLWLNSLGTEALDPFWTFLSNAKVWFPFYAVVMGFVIWKLGWKKGLIVVVSLFLAVLATDQLSGLVKASFQRLRPCFDPWMLEHGVRHPIKPGHPYGFFSSHAANTFGFAIASLIGFKNDSKHTYTAYGWCVMVWAALVSLSRVMLAAHFVGDILVGAVFGLVIGAAIAGLARFAIVKAVMNYMKTTPFLTLAAARYSCRAFTAEPVSEEDIKCILEAARLAPTAVNRQPVHIWVVQDPELREKMKETSRYTFDAPVIFVVGCRPEDAWVRAVDGKNGAEVDAAIVGTHLMMEVADLGLGSTWVGSFDPAKLSEVLPLEGWVPIALFPVGHIAGQPSPRHGERKSLEELVTIL